MNRIRRLIRAFVFLGLLGIVIFTAYNLLFLKPKVEGMRELEKIPKRKEVSLLVTPRAYVSRVTVRAVQGSREIVLFDGKLPERVNEVTFTVEPKKIGLEDGEAKIVVELKRFYFLKESFELKAVVDTKPPGIDIVHAPDVVLQGGSGGIRARVSEPVELFVEVGGRRFRSYRVGENVYVSLFGVPVTASTEDVVKVVAIDKVGNRTVLPLGTRIKRNHFKEVWIELKGKEGMIMPKLLSITGGEEDGTDFVKLFKKVNEEIREQNESKISKIGGNSAPERYWRGVFIQLKNSKVLSRFGERRYYTYGGKLISESWHLGYDLASVKNTEVPAANSGVVVFVGDLGIYGNTVIVDHGYGLMSLYAHLKDFKVKEGDFVKEGQVIGYTDTTGLAFGDHLHFGILIDGMEVTPLEWWDSKWIRTRIEPVFSE